MRRMRIVLLIVTIVSLLIGGGAAFFASIGSTVAQDTGTSQITPLNPEFLDHLENPPEPFYGYIPPPVDLSYLSEIPGSRSEPLTVLPSAFDWRDTGKVTGVKDQNPCGTCWIFGTIAAVESRVLVVDDVEYDFSEQNVACCTDPSWVYLAADRCGAGGWSWLATDTLTKKGTRLESCDPYDTDTINTDSCDDTCTTIKMITGYRWVADSPSQTDEVKNAIYNYGPVSLAYYHTTDPSYWSGNTYYYPDCTEYANHLVSAVGWDDDIEHPEGGGSGAWIIKNSWGTGWGDNGYFYLCYGSASMEEVASYRYQDYCAGETVYYWDEAGWVVNGGYSDNSAWMASVFTCEHVGYLTYVDFWTTSNSAQYELHVYDGSFGAELASQSGTCDELGYYSIPLDTWLPMIAGQQFTVAVKMTTSGYNYPLALEYEISGTVEPTIQSGVCYTRQGDADAWEDAINFAGVGVHVCLRAKILDSYDLTINSTDGGSVTTPGEDTFSCNACTVGNLVATPDTGYQFVNWTGDVDTVDDVNAASTTITMNGNYSITANFAEAAEVIDEIGIFRPSNGIWYLDVDGNGYWSDGDQWFGTFGETDDQAVVGDWS